MRIGQADHLFDVRARDEGAQHDGDLLVGVVAHRQALQQWPKQRVGIDVNFGFGLVLVGNDADHDPAREADNPGGRNTEPPILPSAAQIAEQLNFPTLHLSTPRQIPELWHKNAYHSGNVTPYYDWDKSRTPSGGT